MQFLYRGLVYEMAMPTEEHKGYKLYHGTDEKHAKEILQTGMLKGRLVQGRAQQAPVAGYVYTSKDIMYAAGYAGAFVQWGDGCRYRDCKLPSPAYVFVVDSSKITDVLVDEDILGELGTSKYAKEKYKPEVVNYLQGFAMQVATPTQYRNAKDGLMAAQSAIGKKMHKVIPQDKMQWLVSELPHIAVKGEKEVPIIGYYVIDKAVNDEKEFLENATYHTYEANPEVLEEVKVPVSEVWYHGSKHDFTKFDPQYSYVEGESNARFGPGFYLTQDINEALGYAGSGGFLKEVVIKNLKKIKQADGRVSGPLALKAVNSIPEDRKDSVLSNWAPSEVQAKREIYLSIVQNSQNFGDQAQTIWYECFRYREPDFCRFMAKNLDGIVYPRDGYPCIVGYNAEALQIVKNTPAGPLMNELEAKSGSSS